jgi:hypothetical protein
VGAFCAQPIGDLGDPRPTCERDPRSCALKEEGNSVCWDHPLRWTRTITLLLTQFTLSKQELPRLEPDSFLGTPRRTPSRVAVGGRRQAKLSPKGPCEMALMGRSNASVLSWNPPTHTRVISILNGQTSSPGPSLKRPAQDRWFGSVAPRSHRPTPTRSTRRKRVENSPLANRSLAGQLD